MIYLGNSEKIIFIGGDLRQKRVINRMEKSGIETAVFGFETKDENHICEYYDIIKEKCRAVVLPLPYSTDGENINAPFCENKIKVQELFGKLPEDSLVLAGKCDEKIKLLCENCGIRLIDYFQREELTVRNAIPTAEGAIQIAMEETSHTLHGSKCLVAGGGRIAKVLAKMLHGMGAKVCVSARKHGDIALAEAMGYSAIPVRELHKHMKNFELIFNTVPAVIFDERILSEIDRNCLIIDLASKPGGADFYLDKIKNTYSINKSHRLKLSL